VRILLAASFCLLCAACSFMPALIMKEAQIHYDAALNFESQGDYVSAREQFWKALVAARSAGAPPATLSMLTYEFGRTTGYTCHLKESEEFLTESVKMEEALPERNSRNMGIRFFELARLMYDQQRYQEAATYYSRAIQEVEQSNSTGTDPIAFADIHEEYADALARSGNASLAQEELRKAKSLRDANPGRTADFVPNRYKCSAET
jgi:tetratricopeptide (TPR) repeat protein